MRLVRRQKCLDPRQRGRGGEAGWQPGRGGGSPFPPIPASTQGLGPHATYSYFEKEASCLCGDLHDPTPARNQRGEISRRTATSGGESEARRSPLRAPRAGGDPAVSGQRQRSSPGSQSPLKHHLWRLETEFENRPINGGPRGGPGQSLGGTAPARRP